MSLNEYQIDLTGTPAEVAAMLAIASEVEPRIFKKQWIRPEHLRLWYEADAPRVDLLEALKAQAGLTKPKKQPSKPRAKPDDSPAD